ncbi:CGNR zinc finger domain-containing protein [Streptomyces sp. CNQ431]|uniref:CGNR zinc finger domain-containing protein n=1 Tax=Streptomyces sp. CNQ431 TaxID=1571532 RepID=UPI00053ED604|nr:CGNR zinc finger domain-containing protein [Streptomyces sp. CNQ431]
MAGTVSEHEELLLAVLNSAPVIDGHPADTLDTPQAVEWARALGGTGGEAERGHLRSVRDALHRLIRDPSADVAVLARVLDRVRLRPVVFTAGVTWDLEAPADESLAARTALAWSRVTTELPHRLRPCANPDCNLFLVDHSRPGTARWCSMATCGNRVKARTHARRRRGES